MPSISREPKLALARRWPHRVRSSVVRAVSIANVALTATCSHAEHHFDARVRLQAENDRLRREVSLLLEELRIKDARMEPLPALGTPRRYTSELLRHLDLRMAFTGRVGLAA